MNVWEGDGQMVMPSFRNLKLVKCSEVFLEAFIEFKIKQNGILKSEISEK